MDVLTALVMGIAQFFTGILAYPGIFFLNFFSSLTVLFPIPAYLVVFALGAVLNPWLLATFAAAGSAFGEITGYGVGYGSRHVLIKKYKKLFNWAEQWFSNNRAFLVIIIFGATPLPMDIAGIVAGMTQYNLKRFFLAAFIGKFIMNSYIAWAGFFGLSWVLSFVGWN